MGPTYDVIVIGLGAMGSATCYHLARRGHRVLGLERFDIPHANGSSTGFSRMIRMSYHEHPDYIPLLRSSFELWRTLEAQSGETLLHLTGGLYLGPPDGDLVGGAVRAAEKFSLPHTVLDRAELHQRFPQFSVPEDFVGMLEENAGFVLPERAIAAHALLAMRLGAELHGQEAVEHWETNGASVKVVTAKNVYHAGKIIFCGGAWTDHLVRDLGVPLLVTRQVLGWVWPKRPELFERGRIPVWNIDALDGTVHYGFPMMADNPGFKLAHHSPGAPVNPDTVPRSVLPGDEGTFRGVLRRYIPDADGPLLSLRTCLYTNSPDKHFIVDRHPMHERVILACGFSGHGFKFAPVIGDALADLATKGVTAHPIDFLGLQRLQGGSKVFGPRTHPTPRDCALGKDGKSGCN